MNGPTPERALNITTVCEKLCLGRTTIWRYLKNDPTFPRPVIIGGKGGAQRWIESELDAWLAAKAAERKVA